MPKWRGILKNRRGRRRWMGQVGCGEAKEGKWELWIPSLQGTTRQDLWSQRLAESGIPILSKGPTPQNHHPNSCEGLSPKTQPPGKVVNATAPFSFPTWTARAAFSPAPALMAEPQSELLNRGQACSWETASPQWPSGFLFIWFLLKNIRLKKKIP